MAGNAGKSRNRLFQVLALVILLSLIGYGFTTFVVKAPTPTTVPQYVGTLKLASHSEGSEAATAINRLHGTAINLNNPFIAEYRIGSDHLMVWAGEAGSQGAAADLINRMVAGINKGGAPFTKARRLNVAGQELWQTDGAGGTFVFYISKEPPGRVVWLSIESGEAATILANALKLF